MRKLYFLLILGLSACDIFDEEEQIPSFVTISRADLTVAADGSEGEDTQAIVDAHVFANDVFVGTVELPGTVAILEEGPTRITVGAGIRNNGLTANRIIYPFYQFVSTEIDLMPGVVSPISEDSVATFQYFPQENPAQIDMFIEGFEGVGNVWETEPGSQGIVNTVEPEEVISGFGSGKVTLDDENSVMNVYSSTNSWDLSAVRPGSSVYLEIDYKANNPVEIGIRTLDPDNSRRIFALGLNPTDTPTKVYVDLTNEVGMGQTNNFQIYLEAEKVVAEPLVEIFLDNIKVIYPL